MKKKVQLSSAGQVQRQAAAQAAAAAAAGLTTAAVAAAVMHAQTLCIGSGEVVGSMVQKIICSTSSSTPPSCVAS
jgi:hypothetical protein